MNTERKMYLGVSGRKKERDYFTPSILSVTRKNLVHLLLDAESCRHFS